MTKFNLDPDRIDQFHRSFKKMLRLSEEVFDSMNKWMLKGPKADVIDRGKTVQVYVEAPGIGENQLTDWSYQTSGHHLYLRGILNVQQSVRDALGSYYSERKSEQFTRYIPLPVPVKDQLRSARCENGLLCLEFEKSKKGGDGNWHPIRNS